MVRIGIVGIGNMGRGHVERIVDGTVKNCSLTAVCDIVPAQMDWVTDKFSVDVKKFEKAEDMFKSGLVDAVVIATPHYDHPSLSIAAFDADLHVLCEKPAGVYTKQVEEMNQRAAKSDKVFSLMYNQRTRGDMTKVKELLENGELGDIKRINWIITNWYRPQCYHDSGSWRSSWSGEGGGVLLNQCPHNLDLWWWLFKMPQKIRAFCSFGKHYNIEVDDEVTAYMEYENGATGVFITCTAESPGVDRLEVAGTKGRLVVENNKLTLYRNTVDEREFNKVNTVPFGSPEFWTCSIPVKNQKLTQHDAIMQNFVNAIENGEKLIAPGEEGINGLTMSNCMYMSTWLDKEIIVDQLDPDLFHKMLQEKGGK